MMVLTKEDPELGTLLRDFITGLQQDMAVERRNSLPALVLEAILALKEEGAELSAKALAERLNQGETLRDFVEKPDLGITARRISSIITRTLGLQMRLSSNYASRRSVVLWQEGRIAQLKRRYGLSIHLTNPSEASYPSEKPQNTEESERYGPRSEGLSPGSEGYFTGKGFKTPESEESEGYEVWARGIERNGHHRYDPNDIITLWESLGRPPVQIALHLKVVDLRRYLARCPEEEWGPVAQALERLRGERG